MKDKPKHDGSVVTTYTGKVKLAGADAPAASNAAKAGPASVRPTVRGHDASC